MSFRKGDLVGLKSEHEDYKNLIGICVSEPLDYLIQVLWFPQNEEKPYRAYPRIYNLKKIM